MEPILQRFFEDLRELLRVHYPGVRGREVVILSDDRRPIRWSVPDVLPNLPTGRDEITAEPLAMIEPTGATPCERDILSLLEEKQHRMTMKEVVKELKKPHGRHGISTIQKALVAMNKRGDLVNTTEEDQFGTGYGLPIWSELK